MQGNRRSSTLQEVMMTATATLENKPVSRAVSKQAPLQDKFLNTLRRENIPVSIYLANGIKLQGQIESFDKFVVLLKGGQSMTQMVYKHAISTVVPGRIVILSKADDSS